MRNIPIVSEGGPPLDPQVVAALRTQATLSDVMAWGRSLTPPRSPTEIVTQDEYTHDVVFELRSDCFLVYDTTWLGSVTAVAVWNRQPSATEMLDARVRRGWQPTATAMNDGERVLGFAACIVSVDHRHRREARQ